MEWLIEKLINLLPEIFNLSRHKKKKLQTRL